MFKRVRKLAAPRIQIVPTEIVKSCPKRFRFSGSEAVGLFVFFVPIVHQKGGEGWRWRAATTMNEDAIATPAMIGTLDASKRGDGTNGNMVESKSRHDSTAAAACSTRQQGLVVLSYACSACGYRWYTRGHTCLMHSHACKRVLARTHGATGTEADPGRRRRRSEMTKITEEAGCMEVLTVGRW